MTDYNVNADIATRTLRECLRETANVGSTLITNICDGSTHVIPWGGVDWVAQIGAFIFIATLLMVFIGIIGSVAVAIYKS